MPYLSPPTLTRSEQETLLRVSSCHSRDHLIFSLALGTGLRLSEIVGLDVGDVFTAGPIGSVRGQEWRGTSVRAPALEKRSGGPRPVSKTAAHSSTSQSAPIRDRLRLSQPHHSLSCSHVSGPELHDVRSGSHVATHLIPSVPGHALLTRWQ